MGTHATALALNPPAPPPTASPLLGESPSIVAIRRTIAQVADTNLTVLLQGESGTGKEVVARLLGAHSGRPTNSFIKINCAAVPHELWESEFFGYEPGAFTGANRQKSGKFELAGDGTIFLDEISEMPLGHQAKLLQVLQDGEFSRLGGRRSMNVDVRVIAASNVDLHAAVNAGEFRRDLFYRLNVIPILLPPLRQRRQDLAPLAEFFLQKYAQQYQRPAVRFSPTLWRHLEAHAWPGNVRELENLVKRYVILGEEDAILSELLTAPLAAPAASSSTAPASSSTAPAARSSAAPAARVPEQLALPTGSLLEIGKRAAWQAEREAILRALAETRWNRRLAARQLHISYKSLQNKLKSLLAEPTA